MQNYSTFGLAARNIMLMKKVKMTDIAKELGVSRTYVSEILKGTRDGGEYKAKIAEILGMEGASCRN